MQYNERDYTRSQSRHYHRDSSDQQYGYHKQAKGKRSSIILPPPHVLEAYARIIPDSPNILMEMAEQEQQHRQEWEKSFLRVYSRNHFLGQFLGFTLGILILSVVLYLSQQGDIQTASAVGMGGFLFLASSVVMTLKTKRFERKPRKAVERSRYQENEA